MLKAAAALFYERGLSGVGVAELCAAVGGSKETLYRHFGSKDGLVDAVLQRRIERNTRMLRRAVDDAGPQPAAQLTALFRELAGWYAQPGFRGCAIVNAATQQHDGPARAVMATRAHDYLELCTQIARGAGVADPPRVGRQLLTLLEGSIVLADHHRSPTAAEDALDAALVLLGRV